jgi:hypothetical protein
LTSRYNGSLIGKIAASKKFDGKIDFKNLFRDYFTLDYQDQEMKIYGSLYYFTFVFGTICSIFSIKKAGQTEPAFDIFLLPTSAQGSIDINGGIELGFFSFN